jgi:Glycosyltransferase
MDVKARKFLFLYTRFPDYFYSCVKYLLSTCAPGSEAYIVCYPQDHNAPYAFEGEPGNIKIINKAEINRMNIKGWKPDIIYMAGWGDAVYNSIAAAWIKKVPVIIGLDNPWEGSLRQRIMTVIAPFFFKNKASHLWVAGKPQYEYARRLGFAPDRIIHELYCADIAKFRRTEATFRKRIIYVGRMVAYKRPQWLAEAFWKLIQQHPELGDWRLVMIGNGPLKETIRSNYGHVKQIEITDFIQPAELTRYYHESAIFCMPSHNEHWGVVVHEAAAAGLALLLSDTCGAASAFLINGYNGRVFSAMDKAGFEAALYQLMKLPDYELQRMGERSALLAGRITHETWAANFCSVLNKQADGKKENIGNG